MDFAIAIIGTIASLVGLLLPATGWRQRAIHVAYGVVIFGLAAWLGAYRTQLNRVHSVERAATAMVKDREMHYTHLGYVQATLAFLEKNKDLYPDTYKRAVAMCEQYNCSKPSSDTSIVDLAFAMNGLLTGIATIDSGS
jgi:hypothetical protein